ncbi:hypothetical protein BN434_3706 [Erwinia amylovora CFBP 2585]|nr:hypothetical protein BN433_3765 [Erwinia amylovora Ea266]CCO88064.1 hypothetical protein BN434_3706 [Erwinia amylovora CFBP 2585]
MLSARRAARDQLMSSKAISASFNGAGRAFKQG